MGEGIELVGVPPSKAQDSYKDSFFLKIHPIPRDF
jgi:hypothetical protein